MASPLKIMVVDDTIVYRKILSDIVEQLKDTELLATASNGKIALQKLEHSQPDLVMLDISMPEMDGLETLRNIKSKYPEIEVVMVSGMDRSNANLTVQALENGALDFIAKPETSSPKESADTLLSVLRPVVNLVRTKMISRITRSTLAAPIQVREPERPAPPPVPERKPKIGKIDAVAIGVSTGGPNALHSMIPQLGSNLRVPGFMVQHMPPMFTASLAERLDKDSGVTVVEAADGEQAVPGTIYIAPGGKHMVVRKNFDGSTRIGIIDTPPVNSCKPSVDVLFRSIATVYGGNVLTVILTGMGNDGASGVSSLKRKGAYSIIQDKETSVVWGMPGAVNELNAADEILPLNQIAGRILKIIDQGAL